ncbi:ribonuclease Z-related hydrolase [Geotalea daltonii FRC-32]|uniref:Ribonuclease Z-related hydrolase n=1 Tax=Geotalea daltonii (strain DSM 22248 / JCM 15807 / FRC-32) TaxID=316067 RepID=B9M6X4_GEODF|nr:MBL fold metallo-hydrolase [Geotalea daltonii]ACM21995.1 ribonuclease Z-related hydrolase [Geotalea daltonii FRC-32]
MTPQFHPFLINDPFDDPGLYIDFLFERRAILFDLGDLSNLSARKLLRVSHIFVSHTHVDHFIGFDQLVRTCLGRDKRIRLYGPSGFVEQIEHRLAGYTWNLVENYPTDFTVVAVEVDGDGSALSAEFHCREGFHRSAGRSFMVDYGLLLDEENFSIHCACLDHRTTSLAFCLEEKQHVNVMKNRLENLGLEVGPWLADLKRAVLQEKPDDTIIRASWKKAGGYEEREMKLGDLKGQVLQVVPGQKIAYVTDVVFSPANAGKIVTLAHDADYLFIESTFLNEEADRARVKCHLTAAQAGSLARQAGVTRVTPFHFSAKYNGEGYRLERELTEAFVGGAAASIRLQK